MAPSFGEEFCEQNIPVYSVKFTGGHHAIIKKQNTLKYYQENIRVMMKKGDKLILWFDIKCE